MLFLVPISPMSRLVMLGKKLNKKALEAAMAEMDTSGDGSAVSRRHEGWDSRVLHGFRSRLAA